MNLWLTISLIGLLTFGLRLSFIGLIDRWTLPGWLVRALRFVPCAVLAAIIVPDLVLNNNMVNLAPDNSRLLAGIMACIVAWRTKNILLTLATGMLLFILLQILCA